MSKMKPNTQEDPHELTDLAGAPRSAEERAKLDECRALLIDRLQRRDSRLVDKGRLAVLGMPEEGVAARRARPGFGYRTSEHPVDARH